MRKLALLAFGLGLWLLAEGASAQGVGPYSFYGLVPCRIVDTRNPNGPVGGPALTSGATRNFPITGYCNVPSTAKAVTFNVTMVSPTVDGYITIWPAGGAFPGTSNINAAAGTAAIANAVIVQLTAGTYNISAVFGTAQAGTSHLIIDVTGYFQ